MTKIALDRITIDDRLQHRIRLDDEMLLELTAAYKGGTKVEPVTLIYDGQTHWLPDGHHRYFSCKAAGCGEIDATVYDGDFRAAFLYSLGVNAAHGLRRTPGDVRRVLEKVFQDDEVGAYTNAKIANLVNCSSASVTRVRKELEAEAEAAEKVAALPEPTAEPDHVVETPPVLAKVSLDERKEKELRKKCQTDFCRLANDLSEMKLFDRAASSLAEIKKIAGLV